MDGVLKVRNVSLAWLSAFFSPKKGLTVFGRMYGLCKYISPQKDFPQPKNNRKKISTFYTYILHSLQVQKAPLKIHSILP